MKKFGLILILAFTTFFSSCEKDLYEEAIVSSEKSLKIRKVSLNDVARSENPELYKRIDQLKIKQEKIHARLVYDSINNFYYDDENGKVIEDELGVKSYTFPVYRENSDGKIENVLFSKNKNGEFEVFLVKYSFTDEQLKFLSQYEISQQTAVYTNITANKTVELCIEFWEWISYPINEGDLTGNFGYTGEWILKKKICEDYNEYLDPALGNSTGVDPLNSGSGNSGGIGNAYTTPVPVVITHNEALRRKFFVQQTLTNNQETYFNSLPTDIKNSIFQYLADNSDDLDAYSQEAIDFAQEVVDLSMLEVNQGDVSKLLSIAILLQNNSDNLFTDAFQLSLDPHVDVDLANIPPDLTPNLFGIKIYLNYKKLRQINPEWSKTKCLWEASKDIIHLSLDAFGLIPVGGEIADIANGVLYTIEGDGLNATLSYSSAVPIAGWATASTKFGLMVITTATGKTKLVWKLVNGTFEFGNSGQLRKVLNITSSALQAHHLIPWASRINPVVQRAARYADAFHMNSALNGIAVSTWRNQPNHTAYNNLINTKLNNFINSNQNATPQECYEFLTDLIQDIRTWVINHPNSHLNDLVLP